MAKKSEAEVEFDRRKGEIVMELAELNEEYGRGVVMAAVMEEFARDIKQDARAEFRKQYSGEA